MSQEGNTEQENINQDKRSGKKRCVEFFFIYSEISTSLYFSVSIVFLFTLNIGSGYLAMLVSHSCHLYLSMTITAQVAMTYSVELFICMVMGLVVGHAIFNTGQDLYYCFIVFTIFHIQRLQWEKVWILAVLLRQLVIQMMPNIRRLKTCNNYPFNYFLDQYLVTLYPHIIGVTVGTFLLSKDVHLRQNQY